MRLSNAGEICTYDVSFKIDSTPRVTVTKPQTGLISGSKKGEAHHHNLQNKDSDCNVDISVGTVGSAKLQHHPSVTILPLPINVSTLDGVNCYVKQIGIL